MAAAHVIVSPPVIVQANQSFDGCGRAKVAERDIIRAGMRCDDLRLTGSGGSNRVMEAELKRLIMRSPFDIRLPKDVLGTKTDVTIRCTGRVVRKEDSKEKGKSGLACVIDEYKFKRGK